MSEPVFIVPPLTSVNSVIIADCRICYLVRKTDLSAKLTFQPSIRLVTRARNLNKPAKRMKDPPAETQIPFGTIAPRLHCQLESMGDPAINHHPEGCWKCPVLG